MLHQVNSGLDRGFEESDIISAVIKAITPGNQTRIYLEGRRKLTLAKLMRTMKNHFGEGNVSTIYKQMTNATQGQKQTPNQFITSMFAMRDRVLELAGHQRETKRQYRRKLVQQEMQRGIYAGLKDSGIRQDLKIMLRQPDVDDDDLLDELQIAEACKREHELRFEEAKRKAGSASLSLINAESSDDQSAKSGAKQKSSNKINSNSNNNLRNNNSRNNNQGNGQAPGNLDPAFVAQVTSIVGMQMQQMIAPLVRAQVNELMGVKNNSHTQGGGSTHPRGPIPVNTQAPLPSFGRGAPSAPPFNPNFPGAPSGVRNPAPSGVAQAASYAISSSNGQDGNFSGVQMPMLNGVNGHQRDQRSLGGGKGGNNQGNLKAPMNQDNNYNQHYNNNGNFSFGATDNNYNNWGYSFGARAYPNPDDDYENRNGNSFQLCEICKEANAWACNHCQICYTVEHRTAKCPRKNDPNFVPQKKNS